MPAMPAFVGGLTQRLQAPGTIGGATRALTEAQKFGFFDPMGSPRLRELRRRRALELGAAQRRQALSYGQLIGLDPMAQRSALARAQVAGNAGTAGFLNAADLQEQDAQRQFLQNLYMQQLGYEQQRRIAQEQAKAQSKANAGSIFGSIAGSVIPMAAGLFTGGATLPLGALSAASNYTPPIPNIR